MINLSLRSSVPLARASNSLVIVNRGQIREQKTPEQRAIDGLYELFSGLLRGKLGNIEKIPSHISESGIPTTTWIKSVRLDAVMPLRRAQRWNDSDALERAILQSDLSQDYEIYASPNVLAGLKMPTPELAIA